MQCKNNETPTGEEMANMMIYDAKNQKEQALKELEDRKQKLLNLLND